MQKQWENGKWEILLGYTTARGSKRLCRAISMSTKTPGVFFRHTERNHGDAMWTRRDLQYSCMRSTGTLLWNACSPVGRKLRLPMMPKVQWCWVQGGWGKRTPLLICLKVVVEVIISRVNRFLDICQYQSVCRFLLISKCLL